MRWKFSQDSKKLHPIGWTKVTTLCPADAADAVDARAAAWPGSDRPCHLIWSVLHLIAAFAVYRFGNSLDPSMVQGRVMQDAFNLAAFSVFGFATAVALNWRNHFEGY